MRKYEVSREIYNPCAGIYIFDNNFFREVETDDCTTLANFYFFLLNFLIDIDMNIFDFKNIDLPRKVRYTFNIV